MNKIASLLAALALSVGVQFNVLAADSTAPDTLVKSVTDDVITIVRQDKAIQSGDTRKAVELVETRVLPYFDFAHMTRLAVGKDWKQASPEQKTVLTQEFKTLLVRTYAGALTQIQDETVVVRPVRLSPGDTEVVVRTEIRGRGDPIQLDYRLEKTPGEGAGWKIFNLNVLGVWLVETYRSQFAQEINARGLDGLVNALAERNRTAGSRPRN